MADLLIAVNLNFVTGAHAKFDAGTSAREGVNVDQMNAAVSGLLPYNPVSVVWNDTRKITASATATVVSGLMTTLLSGCYTFRYHLISQGGNTGGGIAFGINYTGDVVRFLAARSYFSTGAAQATGVMEDEIATLTGNLVEHNVTRTLSTSEPNLGPSTGWAAVNSDCLSLIDGVIHVSTSGLLQLWHGCEGGTATSVEVCSSLTLTKTK